MENPFSMENPYSPPQAPITPVEAAVPRQYGGIRRLPYFGIMLGLSLVQNFLEALVDATDPTGTGSSLITLVFFVVSFIPVYYRLKNIGMNPWWCLLMLIPIVNIFVVVRCLAFQEGYEETKKLDTVGRIIVGIILVAVVLIILSVVAFLLKA